MLPILLWITALAPALTGLPSDVVRSVRAVPPHLAGRFRNPAGFQQDASGQYFVFDRRPHVVFGVDEQMDSSHSDLLEGRLLHRRLLPAGSRDDARGLRDDVFDRDGDRARSLQFRGAGLVTPNSLFFGRNGQLLVTPGLYEFRP